MIQKSNQHLFRERLIQLRNRLRDDIDSSIERIPEKVQTSGDLSSVRTHNADMDSEGLIRDAQVGDTQGEMLDAIQEALDRIDKGTYGLCLECGKDISKSRLRAIPYTRYCIDCERKRESAGVAP